MDEEKDARELIDEVVHWLYNETSPSGNRCVIGVSGGIDSSVALGLSIKAVGRENVFALFLPSAYTPPCDFGEIRDLEDAMDIKIHVIDIQQLVEAFINLLNIDVKNKKAAGNIIARIRMIALYYFANSLNAMVVNACNLSEDFVGYTTKYGDSAGDIAPLGMVLKRDVYRMAQYLGIPEPILTKTPSAGLWEKQTDEEELGVSYDAIDRFISLVIEGKTVEDIKDNAGEYGLSVEDIEKIVGLHLKNKHKMQGIKLMGSQPVL